MDPVERKIGRAVADRRHGAAAIEQRLLGDLLAVRSGWTPDNLRRGARQLVEGQPAMANLRRLAHLLAADDLDRVARELRRRADALSGLAERLAEAAWPAVRGADRVLTLSRSSAVAAVLTGAWRRGWRGDVVVFDGSPAGGGIDQARALGSTIAGVRSQPDAAMALAFTGSATRVVVGADAVGRRRFVNVCGTRILAELAGRRKAPVVVVADDGKDLAEGELDQLLAALPTAGDGELGRRWPLFEPVPLDLVTERVAG